MTLGTDWYAGEELRIARFLHVLVTEILQTQDEA